MTERVKVLLVEASGRGFLSHYSHALGLGLDANNVDVQLVSGERDELAGCQVPFEKHACLVAGRRKWRCLKKKIIEWKPQVVHFQWIDNPLRAYALVRFLQRRGIRCVYTPHNILPHEKRWMLMPFYRVLYRIMDRVVARDRHIAWALEELMDVDNQQIAFLPGSPNLLALNLSSATGGEAASIVPAKSRAEKRMLFFGHGSGRKGLDFLLEVIAASRWPRHYHLLLAGEEVTAEVPQKLIELARQKMKISVIDRYVESGAVAQLFASADVLLMPYTRQCKSPILDLAAAMKLPVLKSDRVEGADFRERSHGVSFDPEDWQALLRHLRDDAWVEKSTRYLCAQPSAQDAMKRLALEHLELYQSMLSLNKWEASQVEVPGKQVIV